MDKVVVTKSKLDSLAQHINTKAGTTGAKTIAQMQATVDGITGGAAPVTYAQVNPVVAAYLADVTYSPDDYSTSQVETYANQTTTYRKDQPSGVGVAVKAGDLLVTDALGGVLRKTVAAGTETLYNLAPMDEGADYVVQQNGDVSGSGHLTPTGALRMVKVGTTREAHSPFNQRDLGGWPCDGGTVKYGKLYRGSELNSTWYGVQLSADDKKVMLEQLGIMVDIDLRAEDELAGITASPLGSSVQYEHITVSAYAEGMHIDTWGRGNGYAYAPLLRSIFAHAEKGEACYIHCVGGADRTGTVCMIIEAMLGVAQGNTDKDYELTSFTPKYQTELIRRTRNSELWTGTMTYLNTMTGTNLRDRVVNWAQRIGITIDEINAFRAAMIDGTPTALTSTVDNYAVSSALTNAKSNNAATAIQGYRSYEADITPKLPQGYVISSVQIKMGGVDVTGAAWRGRETARWLKVQKALAHCSATGDKRVIEGQAYVSVITPASGYTLDGATVAITMGGTDVSNYYSNGKISIPAVTGALEIVVTAVESVPDYTNQIPISTDASGNIYNGVGYKNNTALNGTGQDQVKANIMATGFIPVPQPSSDALGGVVIHIANTQMDLNLDDDTRFAYYDANKSNLGIHYASGMVKAPSASTASHPLATVDGAGFITSIDVSKLLRFYMTKSPPTPVKYIRICGNGITGESIITVNEEIT